MRTPYTTIEAIEAYTRETIPDSLEASVEAWIAGVSNLMDKEANRKLVADTIGSGEDEFEVKYFDARGNGNVSIDDAQEIDEVQIGDPKTDVYSAFTDFYSYPKLAPHRRLVGSFPAGLQSVKVSARWGFFNELPEDIKFAATVIASGIFLNHASGNASVKSEKIGNYSVTYADEAGFNDFERAKATIENYRLMEL